MKKSHLITPLAALFLMATLTGCSNVFDNTSTDSAAIPQAFGTVRVSLTQGPARTAMPKVPTNPDPVYTYTFTKDEDEDEVRGEPQTSANGVFALVVGTYTLDVKAYLGPVKDGKLIAEGTATFILSAQATIASPMPVQVTLSPIVNEGTGTLTYSLTVPSDATVTSLTLTRFPADRTPSIDLKASAGTSGTLPAVDAGYWLLQAVLTKNDGSAKAGMAEVVHIYANLTTVAGTYSFQDNDFTTAPITTIPELTKYLNGLVDPNVTYKVPLLLAFNTGTPVPSGQIPWAEINAAVANSHKNVSLNLLDCTAANDTTANTIMGGNPPSGNHFNIIQYNSYIKDITLPATLTSIGDSAFNGCPSLTSVTIPNSVTSIGVYAFRACSGLTSVNIPDSVTSIGSSAFYSSGLTSVNIPNSVTSIGRSAFANCKALTSINIPGSIESIGEEAFRDCLLLSSVTIGNGVTSIGVKAFDSCSDLTSVIIPDSVTSIGYAAFFSTGLTSVIIPDSVKSIGGQAFMYCRELTSVTIGSGVTSIELYTFSYSGLTSVIIPDTVISIGDSAFSSSALTTVTIGSGVKSIGDRAFPLTLDRVTFKVGSDITTWNSNAFPGNNSLLAAYQTGGRQGLYTRSGDNWMKQS